MSAASFLPVSPRGKTPEGSNSPHDVSPTLSSRPHFEVRHATQRYRYPPQRGDSSTSGNKTRGDHSRCLNGGDINRFFSPLRLDGSGKSDGNSFLFPGKHRQTASSRRDHSRTTSSRRSRTKVSYTLFDRRRGIHDYGRKLGGASVSLLSSRFPPPLISSAVGLAQFGTTGALSSHLLDWRVPSLSAEQELLQQVFATAYTDACYRCLVSQDAAASFGPNETLQLVVDQWRADAFDESQDTLRRVVEQYEHDLLQMVKCVVEAEDAALLALANEMAGPEENVAGVFMNTSMSSTTPNTPTTTSSDTSLYQNFMSMGQANIPAMIDCPAVQKAVLHYAMPALGRILVHQGFFLCFWYSSTGEKIGQLEYRACRWVLEAHISHLHVPLCYHFRYKGRGVTAMSLAPIGDNLTTVTEQNAEVAALAQQLASVFSLLPYSGAPGQVDVSAAPPTAAASDPTNTANLRATAFYATRDQKGSLLNAAVDGEVGQDIYFLPRSVQVHFAQDGRYYFLRNSQWFTPWLNSPQSCDAAVQRLCYVNPRLLAVCGAQVSCRAGQRDAFLEENQAALDFMRREVDVGIPRLLHDAQNLFAQRLLRRRRRAATKRLQTQRAAHAAEAREAVLHSTRVRVGDNSQGDEVPSTLSSSSGGEGRETNGVSCDTDWTESEEDASDNDGGVVTGQGSFVPTLQYPFTTTSVVARFSARGYPKSLLGGLLLALLQYPAAPLHMVREVKREILFRGLKAFIRTRAYEARFGVEQLLGRLPHERVSGEDTNTTFTKVSDRFSATDDDEEVEEAREDEDDGLVNDDSPTQEKTPSTCGKHLQATNASLHGGSGPIINGQEDSGSLRHLVERRNGNHNRGDTTELRAAPPLRWNASFSPLQRVSEVSRSRHNGDSESTSRLSFTQRWRQSAATRRHLQHINTAATAVPGDGENSISPENTRHSMWGRLRSLLPDFGLQRLCGKGRTQGDPSRTLTASPDARTVPADAASASEANTTGQVPSQGALGQQDASARGVGIQNPLVALHADGNNTGSNANMAGRSGAAHLSASKYLPSTSFPYSAAASTFFATWSDFNVTTERVLAAFLQYDGTAHPSHVFCDSTRRLYELWELRETERSFVTAAGAAATSENSEQRRATTAQRKALEASLWSTSDMLNRMYMEQVLPFIYRKFRLSPQRLSVLHGPLNEEDRVIVYVRLLDALGVSIEGGEVRHTVPVVMDFSPLCVEVPVVAGAGRSCRHDDQTVPDEPQLSSPLMNYPNVLVEAHPHNRDNDRGINPLQRHGVPFSQANRATLAATPNGLPNADSGDDGVHLTNNDHHHHSSSGSRKGKFLRPRASTSSVSSVSVEFGAEYGAVRSSTESSKTSDLPAQDRPGTCEEGHTRELHYRLPRWIVWRAKGLVQTFLNRVGGSNSGSADSNGRLTRFCTLAPSVTTSPSTGRRCDMEENIGSAEVAGLIPLFGLLYNTPLTAFAKDPHRPLLPPWSHVAAYFLAQLRAVSTTPHLLWDALELYELVDLRTLLREARTDRSYFLARPIAAFLQSPSLHFLDGESNSDEEGVEDEEEQWETSSASSSSTTTQTYSSSSTSVPFRMDSSLPPPCYALALALILRRRTLRSTSDRTVLIQVLRRYVAAIRSFPAALCMLAPLHSNDGQATAEWMPSSCCNENRENSLCEPPGALEKKTRQVDENCEMTDGVESEVVYTAVLSTLQEVLLNADLLLTHFGNPFAAQYRQYTADLVGYLEYNVSTMAATAIAAATTSPPLLPFSNRAPLSGDERERLGRVKLSANSENTSQRLRGLREELDATLQHIWQHLHTYCKPDSQSARDAMQQAVTLFRMQEALGALPNDSSSGAPTATASVPGDTSTRNSPAGASTFYSHTGLPFHKDSKASNNQNAVGEAKVVAFSRDAAVEDALQRACDLFLKTEGASSPITMRAYCNFALYWYSVGCAAEWREWMQRLHRLWCEGGPEDIRQLLMSVFSMSNSHSVGGCGTSSRAVRRDSYDSKEQQGSVTPRLADQLTKEASCGQKGLRAIPPIPFLQHVPSD